MSRAGQALNAFKGRMGQTTYCVLAIGFAILVGGLSLHMGMAGFGVIFDAFWASVYTQRLHDTGRSGRLAVVILLARLVPLVAAGLIGDAGILGILLTDFRQLEGPSRLVYRLAFMASLLIHGGFTVWLGLQKGDPRRNRFDEAGDRAASGGSKARIGGAEDRAHVVARGWSRTELDAILAAFARGYGLSAKETFAVAPGPGEAFTITFPQGLERAHFYFLVNNLAYPEAVSAEGRSIGVVGRAVLTLAMGARKPALLGQAVSIYVPQDDEEGDRVYARMAGGEAFVVPFTTLRWKAVDDPRVPAAICGL